MITRYYVERYRVLRQFYGAKRAWGFFNADERAHIIIGVLFPEV